MAVGLVTHDPLKWKMYESRYSGRYSALVCNLSEVCYHNNNRPIHYYPLSYLELLNSQKLVLHEIIIMQSILPLPNHIYLPHTPFWSLYPLLQETHTAIPLSAEQMSQYSTRQVSQLVPVKPGKQLQTPPLVQVPLFWQFVTSQMSTVQLIPV